MHNLDDKHPIRPGYEPSTSELRATIGPNKPSHHEIEDLLYVWCILFGEINSEGQDSFSSLGMCHTVKSLLDTVGNV